MHTFLNLSRRDVLFLSSSLSESKRDDILGNEKDPTEGLLSSGSLSLLSNKLFPRISLAFTLKSWQQNDKLIANKEVVKNLLCSKHTGKNKGTYAVAFNSL